MKQLIVENAVKKSTEETEIFINEDGDRLYIHTLWRGGEYTINVDEEFVYPDEDQAFVVTDYEIEDMNNWDGCSVDFEIVSLTKSEAYKETLKECVEKIYEEEGYMGLEEAGWNHEDTEVVIYNGVEIREG